MKALNLLKSILFTAVAIGSISAKAEVVGRTVYITNVQGCQYLGDSRAAKSSYIGFYLSEENVAYAPKQKRVNLWVDSCFWSNDESLRKQFIGRKLYVETKPSNYASHWDDDISNFTSLHGMGRALQRTEPPAIKFVSEESYLEQNQVAYKISAFAANSERMTVAFTDNAHQGGWVNLYSLKVDKADHSVTFATDAWKKNEQRQSLSVSDTYRLANALARSHSNCPVWVVMNSVMIDLQLTDVIETCPDISP